MSYSTEQTSQPGSMGRVPAISTDFQVGRVIRNTWSALIASFGTIFILSLLMWVPTDVPIIFLEDPEGATARVLTIIGNLIGVFAQGAVAYAVFCQRQGLNASLSETLTRGVHRFAPMLLATLLIAIALAFIALIGAGVALGLENAGFGTVTMLIACGLIAGVPALALYCRWALAIPVVAVENIGPIKALRRSAELTRHLRWKIFALVLIFFVPLIGAAVLLLYILEEVSSNSYLNEGVFIGFGMIANLVLLSSFATIYYEVRLAKGDLSSGPAARVPDVFD